MKKVYYQLKMHQKSPLRVGSGDHEVTDCDLMLDGRGCPFIPGSSVAGVLREKYAEYVSEASGADANLLFGYIDGKTLSDSRVQVSDAKGPADASPLGYQITVRDGIRLDEWGVTVSGHKYDFQVTETKNPYYAVVEWTGEDKAWESEGENGLEPLMRGIAAQGISFGARTTRGYGKMDVCVRRRDFHFPEDLEAWLCFDPLDEKSFAQAPVLEAEAPEDRKIRICAELEMKGSFSVSLSTARAEVFPDGSVPDSVPLTNAAGQPVIPGSSWAGVFRHHMLSVLRSSGLEPSAGESAAELNRLFGMEESQGDHIRSAITFAETAVSGGSAYSVTRNAVDRFTQAPRNAALFTNRLWQGGKGSLEITVDRTHISRLQAQLLALCLIDLNLGLLTFGKGAGTGQGICEISCLRVDGKDVTERIRKLDSHVLEEFL